MGEDTETPAAEEEEEEMPDSEEDVESIETPTEDARRFNIKGLLINIRMFRRIVQVLFILFINAYIFGAWFGQEQITAFWTEFAKILPTLPIIAPLEAPLAVIAGSFDTLNRELTSGFFPFFTLGAMVIILTILGRVGCGWVCPVGTFQDFATLPKRNKSRPAPGTEKELRRVKLYIFVITMFMSAWVAVSTVLGTDESIRNALGIFADSGFNPLNPAYIIFYEFLQWNWPFSIDTLWYFSTWGTVFWLQIVFVALVLAISYWYPRWFCRWLCPAGWLYGFFSRDALVGIGRNPARCTPDTCSKCEEVCPMNIRIRRFPYQHMYSPDCIMCLDCKSHCPNGAIEIRFS
ncbi:MAG: 4Fe-4S binding protein [Candidatus Thorarchaeota archaeon]|nr:MAG: 4Fe-4S binding protein [Candidatus Thorarchaeota archaeon]